MTTTRHNSKVPASFAEAIEQEQELQATLQGKAPESVTLAPSDPNEPTPTPTSDDVDTLKKRVSDKDRYIQTLSDAAKAKDIEIEKLKQEAADAVARASVKPSNVTDAKITEFYAQYPDAMEILDEVIARRAKEMSKQEVNSLKQEFSKDKLVNEKKLIDKAKLQERYPNFKDFEKPDSVFIEWLGKQSATIQHLAVYENTNDIDAVLSVLDMFTAQVQVKRPSGQSKQTPISANPVANSPIEIPVPRGKFDIVKWDKDMATAQKKGDRKAEDKLMAEFTAAGAMGLFNQ